MISLTQVYVIKSVNIHHKISLFSESSILININSSAVSILQKTTIILLLHEHQIFPQPIKVTIKHDDIECGKLSNVRKNIFCN